MIKAIFFDFFGVVEQNLLPNQPLLDYIKTNLKPKYKIGIISNAIGDVLYEILSKDEVKLFDNIVISHRVGVAKPEPAIYNIALENFGIRAEEAIFVDDIEDFCIAAQSVGMQTICYQNFEQMKTDLQKLLSAGADN